MAAFARFCGSPVCLGAVHDGFRSAGPRGCFTRHNKNLLDVKDRAKLIKYYTRLHYKNIPRTEYYACSLINRLPTENEVFNAVSTRASKSKRVTNPSESARPLPPQGRDPVGKLTGWSTWKNLSVVPGQGSGDDKFCVFTIVRLQWAVPGFPS
jgi:hypothetical protein